MESRWPCCVLLWALRGNTPESRGTAYVVYEDIFDAKNACDHLSGFNVCNRYLVVLYYNANRVRRSCVVSCDSSLLQKMTALVSLNHLYIFQHTKKYFPSFHRLSRRWTQRRKRNSWNFWKRNTASTQTLQSNTVEGLHKSLQRILTSLSVHKSHTLFVF